MSNPKRINKNVLLPITNIGSRKRKRKIDIPYETTQKLNELKNEKIIFSFRFLDFDNEYFGLDGTCSAWANDLMRLLKELSDITKNEFINVLHNHYRSHRHNWSELQFEYPLEDFQQYDCRQARISRSKGGIHGFLIGNCFYIVWLDPQHNLYPDDRYGGLVKLKKPNTCCGFRDEELGRLKNENDKLMELLDKQTMPY